MASTGDSARRVGVEIELGGLTVEECSDVLAETFGGHSEDVSRFERDVKTPLGTFRVELDAEPLKALGAEREPSELREHALDALEKLAGEIVPCEIVAPPLRRSALSRLEKLCVALGDAGARGTYDAIRFGFGVHFNPELEDPTVYRVLSHMRAFALLYRPLVERYKVDPSRRLGIYIDPWPDSYVRLILGPDYRPQRFAELIDDYLEHTPTRNRALDMLPMFAHLDEARVRAALPDEKINARPTFHYRLCNSRVGEPDWALGQEWRSWLEVEALAEDPGEIGRRGAAYLVDA